MSAPATPSATDARRSLRRRVLVAGAALALAAGLSALAAGSTSLSAPLLVLAYVVLIPAALLV